MPVPESGGDLELFQALMTAIKRLEALGGRTDDLREIANRVADPYREG